MQTISNHTSNKDLLKTVDFFGRPAPPPPFTLERFLRNLRHNDLHVPRPPVSSLNVPMLFYDMAGSEVTYSAKW